MIWLFHRHGEYLSCEVRTCLENAGFELLLERGGRVHVEWYSDEMQVERRWQSVNTELRRDGWNEMYGGGRKGPRDPTVGKLKSSDPGVLLMQTRKLA
jgi:hypothetical protein